MAAPRRSPGSLRPAATLPLVGPVVAEVQPAATQPIDSDGIARGCRLPSSVSIGFPVNRDLGEVLPSWVAATPSRQDRRPQPARLVEGVLVDSKISGSDFPLQPWHVDYDWNFLVRVDPQYRNLLSIANVKDGGSILECEWDTAGLPSWAWPQQGQRVWILGRWIFDCAHPEPSGYKTEIHPPKAVVSFRSEAFHFKGTPAPVRANQAVVYIGRNGGYFESDINDQDYKFSFLLPPRPGATAVPLFQVTPMTARPAVRPQVTAAPTKAGGRLLVKIPLKGVLPHPDDYGAIISAGWSDPTGAEARKIIGATVTVEKIFMDANLDPFGADEWYVYVGVNGRWRVFESIGGDAKTLNHTVNLSLHPTDRIRLSVCGFEADEVHDLMGRRTTIPRATVSERTSNSAATSAAGTIRDEFRDLAVENAGFINENSPVSTLFALLKPPGATRLTVKSRSPGKDYRIQYTVDITGRQRRPTKPRDHRATVRDHRTR